MQITWQYLFDPNETWKKKHFIAPKKNTLNKICKGAKWYAKVDLAVL